jgi:hypothetical protein
MKQAVARFIAKSLNGEPFQAHTIHRHLRRKSYNNGAVRQNAAIEFEVPLQSHEVFRRMDKVVSFSQWDFSLAG